MEYDVHFWIVAAKNMLRAVELVAPHVPPAAIEMPKELAERVAIVRNCLEHFEDHNPFDDHRPPPVRSRKRYAELFPGLDPDHLRVYSGGEIFIGGVSSGFLNSHAESLFALFRELNESTFVFKGWELTWPKGRPSGLSQDSAHQETP
jgi:hypothetical protein